MGTVRAIDPHQVDHPITQPAKALQSLLAVGQAPIFRGVYEAIKERLACGKVDAMVGKIGLALDGVEGDHRSTVVTQRLAVNQFVTTSLGSWPDKIDRRMFREETARTNSGITRRVVRMFISTPICVFGNNRRSGNHRTRWSDDFVRREAGGRGPQHRGAGQISAVLDRRHPALVIAPPAGLGAQSARHTRDTAGAVSREGRAGGLLINALHLVSERSQSQIPSRHRQTLPSGPRPRPTTRQPTRINFVPSGTVK